MMPSEKACQIAGGIWGPEAPNEEMDVELAMSVARVIDVMIDKPLFGGLILKTLIDVGSGKAGETRKRLVCAYCRKEIAPGEEVPTMAKGAKSRTETVFVHQGYCLRTYGDERRLERKSPPRRRGPRRKEES